MFKKTKKLLVIALFILLVLASGCLGSDNFTLVDSDLAEEKPIEPTLETISLEFNQSVSEADVILKENDNRLEVETMIDEELIRISDLNLRPEADYQLKVIAVDDSGEELDGSFTFETSLINYPEVAEQNKTLLQTFYWEMDKGEYAENHPEEAELWNLLAKRSAELAQQGITEVWLPPANKARTTNDEGYGAYDIWDLGEFDQAGGVATKYGTREELETAISELQNKEIDVYFDAVLNQRIAAGEDDLEGVELSSGRTRTTYTALSPLKGRQEYYSKAGDWKWDWQAFNGTDYTVEEGETNSFLFKGKSWDDTYDSDFLLGLDIDYQNEQVRDEKKEWGVWLVEEIGFDGFRLDAIKHIDLEFLRDWVNHVQANTEKDVRFIGEAWITNEMGMEFFLRSADNEQLDLFDFPLRTAFNNLQRGSLNMAALSEAGLVNNQDHSAKAVTFVDNHDTGRDSGEYGAPIQRRKMQAYSYILTREQGLPMVYWKDYYAGDYQEEINKILTARKHFAYGPGREAESNDADVYSYVRAGLDDKPGTGLVMMITGGDSEEVLTREIDTGQANTRFFDYTGNIEKVITTDSQGKAEFPVRDEAETGWSIWVPIK